MLGKIAMSLIIVSVCLGNAYANYPYENDCPQPGVYVGDQWGFYKCECTSYAAYRINDIAPIGFSNSYKGVGWHDGGNWDNAAQSVGISVNVNPLPGDVGFQNPSASNGYYGHVFIVEGVNYNEQGEVTSMHITEYNRTNNHEFNEEFNEDVDYANGFIHFLSYEYPELICADHSNSKKLCWSPNGDTACSNGTAFFFDDEDSGTCYFADSSDCVGISGYSLSVLGGRGGGITNILVGPGYETQPTDPPTPDLPNFITTKTWLTQEANSREEYKDFQTGEYAYACSKTKNTGDANSPSDIKVMFLRSNGYKEDAHSDWKQMGNLQNIQASNIEVGETKQECARFSVPDTPGIYNIVACADRTRTQNNGNGDVAEIHESDNCSTEAIFYVNEPPPTPPPPTNPSPSTDGIFSWSSAGPYNDGRYCIQIIETADPHTWDDNYFCSDQWYGIEWRIAGPIAGMKCTQIVEAAEPSSHTWDDNYLCLPSDSKFDFYWSSAGPIANMDCVQWSEPADPHTWDDNYLCYTVAYEPPPPPPPTDPPPPPEYNISLLSISVQAQGANLFPGDLYNIGVNLKNTHDNLASGFYVSYYISGGQYSDFFLGSDYISSSEFPSGSYHPEVLDDIAAPSESGEYTVKACADVDNLISEINEYDNCQSAQIRVENPFNPAVIQLMD